MNECSNIAQLVPNRCDYALRLMPYTPHTSCLTPHALRLTPYALRLRPYALGLTPYALRLTPYALRLTPCALRLAPCALLARLTPHALLLRDGFNIQQQHRNIDSKQNTMLQISIQKYNKHAQPQKEATPPTHTTSQSLS